MAKLSSLLHLLTSLLTTCASAQATPVHPPSSILHFPPVPPASPPFACASHSYPPSPSQNPSVKWYDVNLDAPPQARWRAVVKDHLHNLKGLSRHLDSIVSQMIKQRLGFMLPLKIFFWLLGRSLPPVFKCELEGMADEADDISFNSFVALNVLYELTTACTSIVGRDRHGRLLHGRNLDFGMGFGRDPGTQQWIVSEYLRHLTVNVNFTRNGTSVFKGTTYAGYVALLNGVKEDSFTMSWNQRQTETPEDPIKTVISWVLGLNGGTLMGTVTRRLFEETTSFEEAKAYLESVQLLSPVYFILGGTQPNEGCIITRDASRTLHLKSMNANDSWVVETNYDQWTEPPDWDDRRTPAEACLAKAADLTPASLFNVLSTKPVQNLGTTYTSVMNVTLGQLETYIRKCAYPCV